MAKARVVITDYVWESLDVEHEILGALADIVALQVTDPEAFFPAAHDCEALLNTYGGPITAAVMARMPRCKIIARYGIGVDTIDLDAATEAGIIVTNNPTYCIEEVAEHTLAMLLACARKIAFYDRRVRRGDWAVPPGKPLFRLAGATVGLIGFGNIARRVAAGAAGLAMRVLYADPFVAAGQFDAPGEKVEFEALLEASDYLCVHAPLTAQTLGMLNAGAFAKMKRTAFVVNCSRGPIVDTDALVQALDDGQIAGCALDPTDPEPLPADHALRGRENVIVNPHVAWYSEQAMAGLQRGAPNEVRRVLEGVWPANVVNARVKGANRAGL